MECPADRFTSKVSSARKEAVKRKTHAENSNRAPPERLVDDCSNIGKLLQVLKGGKSVGSDDSVKLGLSFGDEGGTELGTSEHEGDESAG